jgi:hypothetical protein
MVIYFQMMIKHTLISPNGKNMSMSDISHYKSNMFSYALLLLYNLPIPDELLNSVNEYNEKYGFSNNFDENITTWLFDNKSNMKRTGKK